MDRDPSPPPDLDILPPPLETDRPDPLRLLRIFGLVDPGSTPTSIETTELRLAAYLLLTMLAYDTFVWTISANLIFFGDDWGWRSAVPGIGALALAVVFCIFERTLLIAPTAGRVPALLISYAPRVAMIVLGAIITAAPLELLVFKDAIDKRLLAEWQAANVVAEAQRQQQRASELREQLRSRVLEDLAKEEGWQTCREMEMDLEQARAELPRSPLLYGLEAEIREAQAKKREYEEKRENGQPEEYGLDSPSYKKLTNTIAQREKERDAETQRLQHEIRVLEATKKDCDLRLEARLDEAVVSTRRAEADEARADIDELRHRQPASPPAEWASFIERVAVVRDLAAGKALYIAEEDAQLVRQELQVELSTFGRVRGEPSTYQTVFAVFLGVGLLVPSIGIAYKLAMPEVLRDYFNRRGRKS